MRVCMCAHVRMREGPPSTSHWCKTYGLGDIPFCFVWLASHHVEYQGVSATPAHGELRCIAIMST